ncbi:MAG: OmpA family protein [Nitrospirae bacterium]|nr:OmpA family protein [Nitrospirota bacterium]
MKTGHVKIFFAIFSLCFLSVLTGCAGMKFAPKEGLLYYHQELPEAEQAVAQARTAGKDKECPDAFKSAEDLKNKAYDTYWQCRTQEAIAMANDATNKVNALCPETPKPVLKEPEQPKTAIKEPELPKQAGKEPEQPKPDAQKAVETLKVKINFDFDKSEIREADIAGLKKAIYFIKTHPNSKIKIEGHTDSTGPEKYNQKLSERRANTVKGYLIKEGGIGEGSITITGHGELKPADSNKTREGRFENRRAEVLITSE